MQTIKKIFTRGFNKFKRVFLPTFSITHLEGLKRIGTDYGGWVIPENLLNEASICYLVGAGEDISFDVGLAEKYKCNVFIFDPTPRAKIHFDTLIRSTDQEVKFPIDSSSSNFYTIQKENLKLLHFNEIGIWDKTTEMKFYAPKNPQHVSHSILNIQKTDDYFTANVKRLSEIMRENEHTEIDILKIDIEGAEYAVLDSIIEDGLDIKVICVEYDESYHQFDDKYLFRIHKSVRKVIRFGYKIISRDAHHNYTFIRNDVYKQLS